MPSTTNFNWTTPADTDLVKDGAAAIRTLGNSIDTSFVDLKGGTTGQVLAKASNTDLDFTWTADASGIPATIFDAKGDIIAASAADTAARLAVGANNTVLTADSTTATGLKWATVATGAYTSIASGSLSTNTVTISSIPSTYKHLQLFMYDFWPDTGRNLYLRFNSNSGSVYGYANINNRENTVSFSGDGATEIRVSDEAINNSSRDNAATFNIYNYADTNAFKTFDYSHIVYSNGALSYYMGTGGGGFRSTSAISSITMFWESTSTFSGGSYILYGVN